MRILIVNADNIFQNSSANLCHISYIRGLVELGHNVDVLYGENSLLEIDSSIEMPSSVRLIKCDTEQSLYYKISKFKKKYASNDHNGDVPLTLASPGDASKCTDASFKNVLRKILLGVHGVNYLFVKESVHVKFAYSYDVVISLSYPAASHLAVHRMIKRHQLCAKEWIQVWEDPWYDDIYGTSDEKIKKAEECILSSGYVNKIVYVSPITLSKQQVLYPKAKEKMTWLPLPQYYDVQIQQVNYDKLIFGYFGDYYPSTRNLKPFYDAVRKMNFEAIICGNPSALLEGTSKIDIYPRMNLSALKEHEERANVLVFLCNLRNGQIPGKIYQYSSTNKKILFILDGTDEEKCLLKAYFSEFKRYYFCNNNVDDICNAMERLKNDKCSEIIDRPLDCFKCSNIAQKLTNI